MSPPKVHFALDRDIDPLKNLESTLPLIDMIFWNCTTWIWIVIWLLVDSDSLLSCHVGLLDTSYNVTWKKFNEHFKSYSIKRDNIASLHEHAKNHSRVKQGTFTWVGSLRSTHGGVTPLSSWTPRAAKKNLIFGNLHHQMGQNFINFFSWVDIHGIYDIVENDNQNWKSLFFIKHTVSN